MWCRESDEDKKDNKEKKRRTEDTKSVRKLEQERLKILNLYKKWSIHENGH